VVGQCDFWTAQIARAFCKNITTTGYDKSVVDCLGSRSRFKGRGLSFRLLKAGETICRGDEFQLFIGTEAHPAFMWRPVLKSIGKKYAGFPTDIVQIRRAVKQWNARPAKRSTRVGHK